MLLISIIIPVFNEEKILTANRGYYYALKRKVEVIFVDGGSGDNTVEVAGLYGQVLSSERGRGRQKNYGARAATGNILLFLHVDTFLAGSAVGQITAAVGRGHAGGCLTMRIEDPGLLFRVYEWAVNFRARVFRVLDGDLGVFVRRDVFEQVGGFEALKCMEDIVFARVLRRQGFPLTVLKDQIRVSSRKWHEQGFLPTFWKYTLSYLKFWTGCLTQS